MKSCYFAYKTYCVLDLPVAVAVVRSLLGTLRSHDGEGNENLKKAIDLIGKTTILHVHHAFLYISLPPLHDYDVKLPNFTFYRGSTQATT